MAWPLSILSGRRDVMELCDSDVFFYTTFGGEALSLAAAKATIEFMLANGVQQHFFEIGSMLADGINGILSEQNIEFARVKGHPSRTMLELDDSAGDPLVVKALLQQELLRSGVLWGGTHNVSYSHTETDVTEIVNAFSDALTIVRRAVQSGSVNEMLIGAPLQPVFRRTSNFNTKPRLNGSKQ